MKKLIVCCTVALLCLACSNKMCNPAPVPDASAESTIDGAALYTAKCAQCHKCDRDASAPALNGSMKNWPDKKVFYNFVRNSVKLIKTNAYAKAQHKKWHNTIMPAFPELTNRQIDAIMKHCENTVPAKQ